MSIPRARRRGWLLLSLQLWYQQITLWSAGLLASIKRGVWVRKTVPEGWQSKARWHFRLTLGPAKALSGLGQSGIATSCFLSHSTPHSFGSHFPPTWALGRVLPNSQLMQGWLAGAEPGVMFIWAFSPKASDPGFVPAPSRLASALCTAVSLPEFLC